jgi:hypothetical protein
MSSPTNDVYGLLSTVAAGYRLAWAARRQVLPVLAVVLAPMLVVTLALSVFPHRDELAIVDGGLVVGDDGSGPASNTPAWFALAVTLVCWAVALAAGTITAVGALRGIPVGAVAALGMVVRRSPTLAVGLCLTIAGAVVGTWVAGGVTGSVGGVVGLVLGFAILTALAVVAARLLLGVVLSPLGGSGWELTRHRVLSTAGSFVVGGVVLPLLTAVARDRVRAAGAWPVLVEVVDAALLLGVLAVQSGILAHVYLMPRGEVDPFVTRHQTVDLAVVDARLGVAAGRPSRWAWVPVAAMGVPVLLSVGVAVVNPYGVPSVRSHGGGPFGGALAVGWPAGQHPVIVSSEGAWFCDDDACTGRTAHPGGVTVMQGWGTAGIGPDGTVVTAVVTGDEPSGGPFVQVGRCTRADGCRKGWMPVRASAREPFGWPELAVSAAPDGAVWFAMAMPSVEERPGKATFAVTLVRCSDVRCARPQRHRVATVDRVADDGVPNGERVRLSIGMDGRPVATVRRGGSAFVVSCAPVTCADVRSAEAPSGPSGVPWSAPGGVGGPVVVLDRGRLSVGGRFVELGRDVEQQAGAVAVAGGRVYATTQESAVAPPGFRVTVGPRPEYRRRILWRCDLADCRDPVRMPLDVVSESGGPELAAVGADGRVLLVRPERISLVSVPPGR